VATSSATVAPGWAALMAGAVTADNEPFDALEGGRRRSGVAHPGARGHLQSSSGRLPMAPAPAARTHRAHHALVLAMFGAGLAAIAVAVVLTAVANEPNTTPAHKCTDNICSNPPIRTPRAAAGLTSALNISVGGSATRRRAYTTVPTAISAWPWGCSVGQPKSHWGKTSSLISLDFPNVSIGSTQLSGA